MRIAITGYGVVSALGIGKEATREALLHEQTGIGQMQYLGAAEGAGAQKCAAITPAMGAIRSLPVGEVRYSNAALRQLLSISPDEAISRTSLLGLLAAREALAEAGVTDVSRMALLSGTTVGGMDTTERYYTDWQEGRMLEYVAEHEAGASTKKIGEHIGPFAYMTTPSTACSSALNAIIMGANLIKTGRVERVLAGGAECLSSFHMNGFHTLMILDKELCRPFDATRCGLNLGEGAAYLVLESEEAALARGAQVLAFVDGYANACDAFHQTASSADGDGAYRAMNQALQMAGISANQVDYVNAHGTGTPNNDASETAAMRRLFGINQLPPVSSTKSMTGHTTSASGSIETAICLICMQEQVVPANVGWTAPDTETLVPQLHTEPKALTHVVCNSFGFGGNDSSIVLATAQLKPTHVPAKMQHEHAHLPINLSVDQLLRQSDVEVLADVSLAEDVGYKAYISPMDARRLTKQLRRTLIAAKMAMQQAQIEQVDAIMTGTRWGCIDNSVRFLKDMLLSDEPSLKPTYFMQSTHNTLSSLVAIHLHCHGYNCTYSHGEQSMADALLDAVMQMQLGYIRSALVIGFDEVNEDWQTVLEKAGMQAVPMARAIVIKAI